MKLSILICTVPQREEMFTALLNELNRQRGYTNTEIISDSSMDITTGAKRNKLIEQATGEYTVFVDDDDVVPEYYVKEILKALTKSPDCVGMRGWMTTNGATRESFEISIKHGYEKKDGTYLRYPNHITPIKREFTSQVKFPDKSNQEDYDWSMELRSKDLLKNEVFIDKEMYHYKYSTQNKLY